MTASPKILAFSGSLREGSFNQQVVAIAAGGAEAAGAEVTVLNLREIPLPVYDADLEDREGLPGNALTLKKLMRSHDGFLISSPENNSTLSAALKNAIDWASRPDGDEPTLACFKGKTAVIMAASPGGLGGLRGLSHLRSILASIGVLVLPEQKTIPKVHEALAADGTFSDPGLQKAIEALGARLAGVLAKLHA